VGTPKLLIQSVLKKKGVVYKKGKGSRNPSPFKGVKKLET